MVSPLLLQNFALYCMAIVMIILCIQMFKARRFMATVILIMTGLILVLSVFSSLERLGTDLNSRYLATWMSFLGYAIRPWCLYLFILLGLHRFGLREKLLTIPLVLIALVYASSLLFGVSALEGLAFRYEMVEGRLTYIPGPLAYTSHIFCLVYLLLLIYLSLRRLNGKHRYDALSILICAGFTVVAVVLEMAELTYGILNTTVMASVVFYYLFLLQEENRRDGLTGCFDRKTYFSDVHRFGDRVKAIALVDMDGLKRANDEKGHEEGDRALSLIADALQRYCGKNSYVYRIGGDEFVVLYVGKANEKDISLEEARKKIQEQGFSVSCGVAIRESKTQSFSELMKSADEKMYRSKSDFYSRHPELSRRR